MRNLDSVSLIDLAHRSADAASSKTLKYFRQRDLKADSKRADFDPVTVADREAEAVIRDLIERERPEDGILGEEHGNKQGSSGLTWVIDPIDGTRGYISGTPNWGTLLALHDGERPVFGLIDQPYIGERFWGGLGVAEFKGPHSARKLQTSDIQALTEATIFTTYPEVGADEEGAAFRSVAKHCKMTRYGMDCYAYALLADGQIDLVIEAGLQPYDIQAPIAVIEAAGGTATDWQGGPADQGGRVVAAANATLHKAALDILRNA